MEKVKFSLIRTLIAANIATLFCGLIELISGAGFHEALHLLKLVFIQMNTLVILFVCFYNYILSGGVKYSKEGVFIGNKNFLAWNQISIDFKQEIKPPVLGFTRTIRINNLQTGKKVEIYVNRLNELSFIGLTMKYAPNSSDIHKVFEIYSNKIK